MSAEGNRPFGEKDEKLFWQEVPTEHKLKGGI